MMSLHTLSSIPDTRPYPKEMNKNDLLAYADTLVRAESSARIKLAEEQLHGELAQMLANRHYLGFSVALSLAPSAAHYRILWQALIAQLSAQNTQIQWLALPVVLVCGANTQRTLPSELPLAPMKAILTKNPLFAPLNQAHWLPFWLDSAKLSDIDAGTWFAAKEEADCHTLAATFQAPHLSIEAGQSVHVVYALCYGAANLRDLANRATGEMALPLMQVFQEAFNAEGLTTFANPLPLDIPAAALATGSAMRQRMACDVFVANAIRSIRLQYPRVGVVIAAGQNGVLYFSFQPQESDSTVPSLTFTWHLAAGEEIGEVVHNLLDLLIECHVEHVRILTRIVGEEGMPHYLQAAQEGFNPFFDQTRTFNA